MDEKLVEFLKNLNSEITIKKSIIDDLRKINEF